MHGHRQTAFLLAGAHTQHVVEVVGNGGENRLSGGGGGFELKAADGEGDHIGGGGFELKATDGEGDRIGGGDNLELGSKISGTPGKMSGRGLGMRTSPISSVSSIKSWRHWMMLLEMN